MDNHGKIVKFCVDRMVGLSIAEVHAVRKPKDFDVSEYFNQIFSMYDGEECKVTMICENEAMKHIVDRLGDKVFTAPNDSGHFIVTTNVSLS